MEGFIFLFFLIIVFNVISSIGKQNKKKKVTRSPWQAGGQAHGQTRDQANERSESQFADQSGAKAWEGNNSGRGSGAAHSQSAKKDHARAQSAREVRRALKNRINNRNALRRDAADNNRHRSYNWGERAGPGFLTIKNIFVLMALAFIVLFALSQLPVNF